jgi:hypothetical protein
MSLASGWGITGMVIKKIMITKTSTLKVEFA